MNERPILTRPDIGPELGAALRALAAPPLPAETHEGDAALAGWLARDLLAAGAWSVLCWQGAPVFGIAGDAVLWPWLFGVAALVVLRRPVNPLLEGMPDVD